MNGSIKGIGCDIVNISRIAELLVNERFLDKVYTAYEQNYIRRLPDYGQPKKLSVKLLEPVLLNLPQKTLR